MTQDFQQRSWLANMRVTMSMLLRRRHYAVTDQPRAAKTKLEPNAKSLADAGRHSTTLAD
jgi:hypothetical protein